MPDYEHLAKLQARKARKLEKQNRILLGTAIALVLVCVSVFAWKEHNETKLERGLQEYEKTLRSQSEIIEQANETLRNLGDSLVSVSYERDEYKARYESAQIKLVQADEIVESQKTTIYGLRVALRDEKQSTEAIAARYIKQIQELRGKLAEIDKMPEIDLRQQGRDKAITEIAEVIDSLRVAKYGRFIRITHAPKNAKFLLSIYPVGTDRKTPIDHRVQVNNMGIVALDLDRLDAKPPFVMEMQVGNRVFYHKSITNETPDGILPTFEPGTKNYIPHKLTGSRGERENG